ncbi:hypothetical protein HDE71_004599 [Janthinobacterium sp. S3M3]|nr:hypothetical protein [Janthinobacterium sp. S3T4]MBB5615544.1 hypothetical protein [Janthinobacterium sp. S3M3]
MEMGLVSGTLTIRIADGQHCYALSYSLPQ